MLLANGVLTLALLALWIYCVLDVITTNAASVRNLPKLPWLFIVLLFPAVGSVAWLVAGRPRTKARVPEGDARIPAEYDRPGRAIAQSPDDDAAFLAQLKARAEQQRAKAAEQAKQLREAENKDEPPPPA